MKRLKTAAVAALTSLGLFATPMTASAQQVDAFLGEVRLFGYDLTGSSGGCPAQWAPLDGQLLPIAQNTALFSLLGTTYGGDGRSTFALPDLRGRTAMHNGQGPGLTPRMQGQRFGTETNTISIAQMPPHDHQLRAAADAPDSQTPANSSMTVVGQNSYKANPSQSLVMAQTTTQTGGGQPVNNIQPVLVMNYCIALQGTYPSRS